MLTTVEGIYRNGKIELTEIPAAIQEETQVIVTFLRRPTHSLKKFSVTEAEAAELRGQLLPFAEDWEQPEMDLYDDYDAAKAAL